ELLAEREHDLGRVVAALADERDELLVLRESGAGGTRQRLLLGERGRGGDELAQRLEVAQLQVRSLPEERVDVGRELLESHAVCVAEVASCAQLQPSSGLAALPEPPHHSLHPNRRSAD